MSSETEISWDAPTVHGEHSIEIEVDHPVNPWEHEGAGRIIWGASLDRLAPLGAEAVSIIKEAWDRRSANHDHRVEHQGTGSQPVDRVPSTGASLRPGWAARIEVDQYWIHLTLHQPVNQHWYEEVGKRGRERWLINDGVLKRGVTVEATTDLGHRALRIVEALHSNHPFGQLGEPNSGDWYR